MWRLLWIPLTVKDMHVTLNGELNWTDSLKYSLFTSYHFIHQSINCMKQAIFGSWPSKPPFFLSVALSVQKYRRSSHN